MEDFSTAVPGSSSLTGADSWKAEQFCKECQEAGWSFQCRGTYWQIFYTTDENVQRIGAMTEELDYGGGTDITDVKEAVDVFYQGQTE